MPDEATLITTIAAALGLAMIFGFIAAKLKMPPLVGYLVAGVFIGPHTRGFVGDVALAGQLADIGVMLLMFGVGLHFSLDDLSAVRGLVVPGALIQICAGASLGAVTALAWGWRVGPSVVFGLSLSVASTVVVLRALEARGASSSFSGRAAIGWLIVQDLVMVLVLVLLPALSVPLGGRAAAGQAGRGVGMTLAITLGEVAAFVILMLVVGRRVFPRLLWGVAKTGSRELFTLCVVAAAVGVAYGSARLFGVSFALGAFFAGMMMRESALSHRAAQDSLPLQDAFSVLFFVSVGMLFDPMVLARQPLAVLTVVAIVMVGTPLVTVVTVTAFRYPLGSALMVGASLGQIGEFSFILAALGVSLGLLSAAGQSLILAAAIISMALNPLMFAAIGPLEEWIRRHPALGRRFARGPDPLAGLPEEEGGAVLSDHLILVGYGRVGRRIASALAERHVRFVVIEENREAVETLRRSKISAVSGNAAEPAVLIQANVALARMLVIATPDTVHVRRMAELARMLNPRIEIVFRTHSEEEAELLRRENAGEVFMGEHELARGMTTNILERMVPG